MNRRSKLRHPKQGLKSISFAATSGLAEAVPFLTAYERTCKVLSTEYP
jgi:hypothetical protein